MFSNWQQEKAKTALVDEAQALADKLAAAKRHHVDEQAAAARYWVAVYLNRGLNLQEISLWPPAEAERFAKAAAKDIAALRKKREYGQSDGLTVWLHTARALAEPRILPPAKEIWRQLSGAGPNAESMAEEMMQDAGLPLGQHGAIPAGFDDPE